MPGIFGAVPYDQLHNVLIEWDGPPAPDLDRLIRDLVAVESAVHQSMVIVGPWFEARVSHLIRTWLPLGWTTSGPAQIFDPARPGLRSRSWDIVVHRDRINGLPPEACPGSGFPLLPKAVVAAVIDTKTHYSTPKAYAAKPLFNLMNDSSEPQFAFLGEHVRKMLFIARSDRPVAALSREGEAAGVEVYCLARMRSGAVSDGDARTSNCTVFGAVDRVTALDAFRTSILQAVELSMLREQAPIELHTGSAPID